MDEKGKWFYGVSEENWKNWGDTDYLVLIMPDVGQSPKKDKFIILQPDEAKKLFKRCSVDKRFRSKRIHVHYRGFHNIYIREFEDFSVTERMRDIELSNKDIKWIELMNRIEKKPDILEKLMKNGNLTGAP